PERLEDAEWCAPQATRVRGALVSADHGLEEPPRQVGRRQPKRKSREALESELRAPGDSLQRREGRPKALRVGLEIARPAVQELERRLSGQPSANDCLVHAVSGERIDEPGGVADEENTPFYGLPRRPPHRQPVPAQVADVCFVDLERRAEFPESLAQPRAFALPAADAD